MKSDVAQHLDWSVGRIKFDPEEHRDIGDLLRAADEQMYAQKSHKSTGVG